jgi:pSer/pThr/pTyr-binding forkhead associated (FHA) protein
MNRTIVSEDLSKLKSKGKLESRGVLLVLSDNFFGRTFIVDKPDVIIGRNKTSDFMIDDQLISREHCRIGVDENQHFFIEDLDSTNSSSLNSKKLKKRKALYYGDKICMGNTILRFFREESAE